MVWHLSFLFPCALHSIDVQIDDVEFCAFQDLSRSVERLCAIFVDDVTCTCWYVVVLSEVLTKSAVSMNVFWQFFKPVRFSVNAHCVTCVKIVFEWKRRR